jgi:hypothetical protein
VIFIAAHQKLVLLVCFFNHIKCGTCNEEPDNRRRCRRWDQKTPWRHFSSVDVAPWKTSCTFFYRIFPKRKHFVTWIHWKQRENSVTPLAAPRRGLVLQVPHWTGSVRLTWKWQF